MILSILIKPQKFTYIVIVYLLDMTVANCDMSPCSLVGNYWYLTMRCRQRVYPSVRLHGVTFL